MGSIRTNMYYVCVHLYSLFPIDSVIFLIGFVLFCAAYPSGYEIKANTSSISTDGALSLNDWVAAILSDDNLLHPPTDIRTTLLVPTHFDNDGMLRQKGRILSTISSHCAQSYLWAAGFSFCRAKVCWSICFFILLLNHVWCKYLYFSQFFIENTPYDGSLQDLFFGEELSIAAR